MRYGVAVANDPDEADRRTASQVVAGRLQGDIEAGRFAPGASLPPYRQLASEFGVAINTALAAVRLLRDRGVVTIRKNAGAVVRDPSEGVDVAAELAAARSEIADLKTEVREVSDRLGDIEQRLATVADQLGDPDQT
jgi:DNA-binding FadR family transcriptional regulator